MADSSSAEASKTALTVESKQTPENSPVSDEHVQTNSTSAVQRLAEAKQALEAQSLRMAELQQAYTRQSVLAYQLRKDFDNLQKEVDTEQQTTTPITTTTGKDSLVIAPIDDTPNWLNQCCVILVRPSGPINLGQISRVCANLAVSDIRIVDPQCMINCSDSRKFASHSLGLLVNAPVYASLSEAIHDCTLVIGTSGRAHNIKLGGEPQPFFILDKLGSYLQTKTPGKFAMVFGNESVGLNNSELSLCDALVSIPSRSSYCVYNLGHSVVITLYTLSRMKAPEESKDYQEASSEHRINRKSLDRLTNYVVGSLERLNYFQDEKKRTGIVYNNP